MSNDLKPDTIVDQSEGYVFKDIAKSPKRAIARSAEARVRMTTKSALQWYIQQYLSSTGIYRNTLKLTAPFAGSFITDISGNQTEDPTVYNVQLARMWKGLREKLPGIIIADTGVTTRASGAGGVEHGQRINDRRWAAHIIMDATVTLDIMIVSMDQTTTGDLADILMYVFGPLTRLNKAWQLYSSEPTDKWEIRLPMNGVQPAGLERRNITEDQVDSLWSTTLNLEVEFEGSIYLGFENQLNPEQLDRVNNLARGIPPNAGAPTEGNILADKLWLDWVRPKQVYLGKNHRIEVRYVPSFACFISDDPRVALVDERGIIYPKTMGTFNILVIDRRGNPSVNGFVVLETVPVTVTFS